MKNELYNAEILADMLDKFSLVEVINFCKLNAYKFRMSYLNIPKSVTDPDQLDMEKIQEAGYEANWWNEAAEELTLKLKEN